MANMVGQVGCVTGIVAQMCIRDRNYIVGVDGLSATLVLLTSIVGLGGVLVSWSIEDRPREFYAFFMLLVAGVHGVFIAVDAFLLFFFYELAVLPMYVLIVVWGWKVSREYAAMKLTLYLLIGSFVSFIAFLVLYFTPCLLYTSRCV